MEGVRAGDAGAAERSASCHPPCIRGMRLTVRRVVEAAALYPNRDGVRRAMAFAAANLEDSAAESNAA